MGTPRLKGAWGLMVFCIVNWPLSMVTYAKSEPPAVLSLSWAAVIITCIDIIFTAEVKQDTEGK